MKMPRNNYYNNNRGGFGGGFGRGFGAGRNGFGGVGIPFLGGLAGGLLGTALFPNYGYGGGYGGYPSYGYPSYGYPPYGYPPYGYPPYGYGYPPYGNFEPYY